MAAIGCGIAAVSLGGASLVVSAGVAMGTSLGDTLGGRAASSSGASVAIGLLIGGVIGIAGGIPLILHGMKRVPVRATSRATFLPRSPLPAWVGAPEARGWAWRF
jgi:hypothetical protein